MSSVNPHPLGAPTPPARTNVMAIIALIFGFAVPVAGIVLGFVALSQIRRTREGGRALAITGIIVGAVLTVCGTALFLWWGALLAI